MEELNEPVTTANSTHVIPSNITATTPSIRKDQKNPTSHTVLASCSENEAENRSSLWYKGCKLDAGWLKNYYPEMQSVMLGRRNGLKCLLCFDNISEAKKVARNGQVPIADGVRCDGKQELQRIIDHLKGDVHDAAVKADQAKKLWESQSDKHPWVKVMKAHDYGLVNMLIHLAVDVHNDSVTKTLPAWSWPSRSLAHMHAENICKQFSEHGLAADFIPFTPTDTSLLYRNPKMYHEMLSIVCNEIMQSTVNALKVADCFASR